MSNKKSYMDADSILSEGLWDSLVNILVPKSYIEKHKEYYTNEIKKVDKELEELKKESTRLAKQTSKLIKKQYGVKISDRELKNYWKKVFEE